MKFFEKVRRPLSAMVWMIAALLFGFASAKVYERCELARELKFVHGVPDHQLPTWVCIADHESRYNTSAVGHLNKDGSGDHGIFQINDNYWCSPPGNGLACGLTCNELEDDDITDDYICAQKIYKEHKILSGDGFNAWAVYKPLCKGSKADRYIKDCFNESENPRITSDPSTTPSVFAHRFFGNVAGRTNSDYTSKESPSFDAFFTPSSTFDPFSRNSFFRPTPRTNPVGFVPTTNTPSTTNRFFFFNPTSTFAPTLNRAPFLESSRTPITPSTNRFPIFTPTTTSSTFQSTSKNSANEPIFIVNGVKWY